MHFVGSMTGCNEGGSIMLAAMTAAMMSTVDSLLIVAGSALSVDIYQNLIKPDVSPERRIRRWRLISPRCAAT